MFSSIVRLVAIIARLSAKEVKKAAKTDSSSIESSSPIRSARELDKPIKFELDKLFGHIKTPRFIIWGVLIYVIYFIQLVF